MIKFLRLFWILLE